MHGRTTASSSSAQVSSLSGSSEARPRVVLITGANRGLGHAIATSLLSSPAATSPLKLYLCARHPSAATAALQAARDAIPSGIGHDVTLAEVSIGDEKSVSSLVARLAEEQGRIDVLINNAGILLDGSSQFGSEMVQDTLDTNWHATRAVTEAFLPLLMRSSDPRVVSISSTLGRSALISSTALRRRFTQAQSVEEIEQAISDFQTSVERGTLKEDGWPGHAYGMSKIALTAYMKVMNRLHPSIAFSACCPGWVKTDMSPTATKTAQQGAKTPVALALTDLGRSKADFFRDEKAVEW